MNKEIVYGFNPLTILNLFLLSIDERVSLMANTKKTISNMYSNPIKGERKGYF
jgi:hypothetical protein